MADIDTQWHPFQTDAINEALFIRRPEIIAICKRFKVKRLDTFDSGSNGVERIGFVVDFLVQGPWGNVEAYYGLQRALEGIFDEDQGLCYMSIVALKDPYMKRRVQRTRTPFYVHGA